MYLFLNNCVTVASQFTALGLIFFIGWIGPSEIMAASLLVVKYFGLDQLLFVSNNGCSMFIIL